MRDSAPDDAPLSEQTRTGHIRERFSEESNLPLLMAPHAGIIPVIHAFKGPTDAFRRFLPDIWVGLGLQMTRATWMVSLE